MAVCRLLTKWPQVILFSRLGTQTEIKRERDREKERKLQLQMNDAGAALS